MPGGEVTGPLFCLVPLHPAGYGEGVPEELSHSLGRGSRAGGGMLTTQEPAPGRTGRRCVCCPCAPRSAAFPSTGRSVCRPRGGGSVAPGPVALGGSPGRGVWSGRPGEPGGLGVPESPLAPRCYAESFPESRSERAGQPSRVWMAQRARVFLPLSRGDPAGQTLAAWASGLRVGAARSSERCSPRPAALGLGLGLPLASCAEWARSAGCCSEASPAHQAPPGRPALPEEGPRPGQGQCLRLPPGPLAGTAGAWPSTREPSVNE